MLQAVSKLREILTILRIDAQSTLGIDIKLPDPRIMKQSSSQHHHQHTNNNQHTANSNNNNKETEVQSYDDMLHLGLSEALGINDLTTALESLTVAMPYISEAPIHRQAIEIELNQLKQINHDLQKNLQSCEKQKSELVHQYKEEIQSMNLHITELRRNESKNPHLIHQITELEGKLRHTHIIYIYLYIHIIVYYI